MSDYKRERRILIIGMCTIFGAIFGYMMIYGLTHRPQPIVNGVPDELIIEVPLSYGEPIAVAASRSGTFDKHMVTILFERGVITIQLKYGQSYRLVYVDG